MFKSSRMKTKMIIEEKNEEKEEINDSSIKKSLRRNHRFKHIKKS